MPPEQDAPAPDDEPKPTTKPTDDAEDVPKPRNTNHGGV
jgi:hypothetical protein